MRTHRIAVIPGDGIGHEVVPEGLKVLDAAARACGEFRLCYETFPWGCGHYLHHGQMMPPDAIDILSGFDAIYLGGVGMPDVVPEEVAVRGLVIAIRVAFDQFANVRPIRPLPNTPSVLSRVDPTQIDLVVIRENTEGMYVGLGGRHKPGEEQFERYKHVRPAFPESAELAVQTGLYSEAGCRRVMRYAFELAVRRNGRMRVTSCTKANALNYGMTLWNDVFGDVARGYPQVTADWQNVDAMAMRLMVEPQAYDVIVAPNLFGDIITDLTAVLQGGLGLCPGANISRTGPSMFEPPHGTAPDIAGQGIANPVAAILTGALMLEHLGETAAARAVQGAVEAVLAAGTVRTRDMGGDASCEAMGDAVAAEAEQQRR